MADLICIRKICLICLTVFSAILLIIGLAGYIRVEFFKQDVVVLNEEPKKVVLLLEPDDKNLQATTIECPQLYILGHITEMLQKPLYPIISNC